MSETRTAGRLTQGRLLETNLTRKAHPDQRAEWEHGERRSLFARFTAEDQGRGRVFVGKFETAEDCAEMERRWNFFEGLTTENLEERLNSFRAQSEPS